MIFWFGLIFQLLGLLLLIVSPFKGKSKNNSVVKVAVPVLEIADQISEDDLIKRYKKSAQKIPVVDQRIITKLTVINLSSGKKIVAIQGDRYTFTMFKKEHRLELGRQYF